MAEPFVWGMGGQKITTPEQAKRQRDIAAALLERAPSENWAEGLGSITAALASNSINDRASTAEEEGAARAGGLFSNLAVNSDPNAIIAALTSPDSAWASPAQTSIASALLNQGLERQDPMYQLQLQTAQAELDALQNPGASGPEYFGSTLPYEDAQGNLGYIQLSKGGLPQLPNGARWLEPTSTVNTGTAQTVIGRNTGAVQGAIPIDNMGAAQATATGTGMGQQTVTGLESGRVAAGNNAKLDVLEQTLGNAPQGAKGAFVQAAGNIGIPLEGLDDIQAAQAIINQMVPLQRPPGSGTMSDADLALFKQSLPSVINQPGANKRIIDTMRAINDYTIAQTEIERQVLSGAIDRSTADRLQKSIPNPLASMSAGQPAAGVTSLPNGIKIEPWQD